MATFHCLKRFPRVGSQALQEQKRGSVLDGGGCITKEESVIDVSLLLYFKGCFLKQFNVLPQLESSVSKITNGPYFSPSLYFGWLASLKLMKNGGKEIMRRSERG